MCVKQISFFFDCKKRQGLVVVVFARISEVERRGNGARETRLEWILADNIQQQMKYHRKLQLLKLYAHRIRVAKINNLVLDQQNLYSSYFAPNGHNAAPVLEGQQDESLSSQEEPLQVVDGNDDDFNITDYINSMSNKMRQQFRQSNPQLPEIFFMTKQEKKKYFDNINKTFKDQLAGTPQRKSKCKKILKFRNQFEIKPFSEQQKVVAVAKAKLFRQGYQNNLHFS